MALRINTLFFFAALILFLFLSTKSVARPQGMAKSASEDDNIAIEVIKNVKKNKVVQDLGRFVIKQRNKMVPYSELLGFSGVTKAKRWPVLDGWKYYLFIKSEKLVEKIKGCLNAHVNTSPDGIITNINIGIFMPKHA